MEEEEAGVDIVAKCSMLEIYKENLFDLFCPEKLVGDAKGAELKIKENPRRGIYVDGLKEEVANLSKDAVLTLSSCFIGGSRY